MVKQSLAGELPSPSHSAPYSNRGSHGDKPTAIVNGISEQQVRQPSAAGDMPSAAGDTPMDTTEMKQEIPDAAPTDSPNNGRKSAADVVNASPMNSETIEKLRWKHKCEIEAIKHNAGKYFIPYTSPSERSLWWSHRVYIVELATMEMRKSIELEKERALWRLRKQLEHKFKRIIDETKKKQWVRDSFTCQRVECTCQC